MQLVSREMRLVPTVQHLKLLRLVDAVGLLPFLLMVSHRRCIFPLMRVMAVVIIVNGCDVTLVVVLRI